MARSLRRRRFGWGLTGALSRRSKRGAAAARAKKAPMISSTCAVKAVEAAEGLLDKAQSAGVEGEAAVEKLLGMEAEVAKNCFGVGVKAENQMKKQQERVPFLIWEWLWASVSFWIISCGLQRRSQYDTGETKIGRNCEEESCEKGRE